MIGQTISHYHILEKLGEGGMGVVYKAHDTKLDRTVALKFLPKSAFHSTDELVRFQQEAKALSSLNHGNIATIHDFEVSDDYRFIVLEYLPGGTLRARIQSLESSGSHLPFPDVMNFGIQIAGALGHAHRRGIIHRDVKTDNVMLTDEGHVKLTDFGLAKLRGISTLTKAGTTVGTAAYMSPEQINGEDVDFRSDIFSLGIVLYELTTGHLPFPGDHEAALSYSIVNKDPLPLDTFRSSVPDSLSAIITRCLQKEKDKRFQSADEVVDALKTQSLSAPGAAPPRKQRSFVPWVVSGGVILLLLLLVYLVLPHQTAPVERKSIAVLPFKNMSDDRENEYFSDGMTEDIIAQLSKIASLKVISRTSVMQYKNKEKSLRDIGKELGVATVLEGSVRRSSTQVRIVAQLIDATTDEHLWAETYDKELTQIFAIQTDVAHRIAEALQAKLSPIERGLIEKKNTENVEAYNLYLKGRYHWNGITKDDLKKAISFYNEAVEKDPNYALAFAGLSDCYALIAFFNYDILPSHEAMSKAKSFALKALELDDNLAEAHSSLGYVLRTYEWDWAGAERAYRESIRLKPNYSTAHDYFGLLLIALDRPTEALVESDKAVQLDPHSYIVNVDRARILYYARQYDRAIDQIRAVLANDSTNSKARAILAGIYVQKNMKREALTEYIKSGTLSGTDFEGVQDGRKATVDVAWGKYWQMMLREAQKRWSQGQLSSIALATLYIQTDNKEKAIESLRHAVSQREGQLVYLRVDPAFDGLRSDKRFVAILHDLHLLP